MWQLFVEYAEQPNENSTGRQILAGMANAIKAVSLAALLQPFLRATFVEQEIYFSATRWLRFARPKISTNMLLLRGGCEEELANRLQKVCDLNGPTVADGLATHIQRAVEELSGFKRLRVNIVC